MSAQSEIEKRDLDDASKSTIVSKRRKVETAEINVKGPSDKNVDPSELASAFALASLASLSPGPNKSDSRSKDALIEGVQHAASYEETRSPKADQAPYSPEQRAPGSPKAQDQEPVTPDERTVDSSRRVHFAQGTKAQTSTPTSILRSRPSPSVSRRVVVPPQRQGTLIPRPRHPYGMNAFMRTPPPPPAHHLHHPTAFHHPQPWFPAARGMYPQRLMQPTLLHPENQWICDFCNVAAFATYEEACGHETTCKHRMRPGTDTHGMPLSTSHPVIHESGSLLSRSSSGEEETMSIKRSASSDTWHNGSMSLVMEESDREWLSELNCYVRAHCVEAFSACDEDVTRSSKRGRIALNQVGVRCRYCAHLPLKEKSIAAVSFPTSIGGIYESVKRWQRVHLEVCEAVPQDARNKLATLANTNVWVPTTRQYWSDSAKALGLVDTNEGIRFGINPLEIRADSKRTSKVANGEDHATQGVPPRAQPMLEMSTETMASSSSVSAKMTEGGYIIYSEDVDMIPPYVYYLMRQVEPCQFTEADRFVARSKGPVGYPGFECRHCNGHAGLGKYFPVSAKSLSTNSTSQNIHAHLLKCRKCPDHVKDQLVQLKIEKSRSPRLEPGWRKVFFDKVWGRLHG